jgi:hypothetical protein
LPPSFKKKARISYLRLDLGGRGGSIIYLHDVPTNGTPSPSLCHVTTPQFSSKVDSVGTGGRLPPRERLCYCRLRDRMKVHEVFFIKKMCF